MRLADLLKLANMNNVLVFLLLASSVTAAFPKRRVKRFFEPIQSCNNCQYGDFGCWTHCDPNEISWRGPCHLCIPGDWRCLKFCHIAPYPIPPYCDSCPATNYMCIAECTPRPDHPRSCCHTCQPGNILCLKTCVYCQPHNPWPCYQCAGGSHHFCKQYCGTKPPCSRCYDWDPDYVRCLRVCIPDHHNGKLTYGPYGHSRPPRCNVDVWGSWCADTWFQGLSQTERAALLRQVMFRLDSEQNYSPLEASKVILMPTI